MIHTNLDDVIAETGADVEVKWYDNQGDPAVMLQNTQLMVADDPDALVIYPVSTATGGISEVVADSGLPCVAVSLDVEDCDFLNIDNAALGVDTATIIGEEAEVEAALIENSLSGFQAVLKGRWNHLNIGDMSEITT